MDIDSDISGEWNSDSPGGQLGRETLKVVLLSDFQLWCHCQIQCDAKATSVLVWTHEAVVCDIVAYVPN